MGTLRSVLEDDKELLRKAGVKLVLTAPAISAYISLIRAQQEALSQVAEEYCVLDLGYEAIRMYMFRGDKHVATRLLEMGMSNLDNVLADVYGVDVHLAHTYLMSNYENCQTREECVNAYSNIAVELMRALNFYRFSNPDSSLEHMWLCGGGAVIEPLAETIGEMLNIQLHSGEGAGPRRREAWRSATPTSRPSASRWGCKRINLPGGNDIGSKGQAGWRQGPQEGHWRAHAGEAVDQPGVGR